jgi:hypothetical protein
MSQKKYNYGLSRPIKKPFPRSRTTSQKKKAEGSASHECICSKEPMICKFEKEKAKQLLLLKVMKEATKI